MSLADCAAQAVLQWPRDDAITMVAIAGAESGWRNDARGDHYSIFPPDQQATYRQYSCDGYTSWGLWQVNMRWHYPRLQEVTFSTDPCVWAAQLSNPGFNAVMAAEIRSGQGLSAWSTYNNGAYRSFIDQATAAVDEALGVGPPPPVIPPPIWPPLPAGFLTLPMVDPLAAGRLASLDVAPVEPPPGFH